MAINAADGKLIQYTATDSAGRFSFTVPDSLENDSIYLFTRITSPGAIGCGWMKIQAKKEATVPFILHTGNWPLVDVTFSGMESERDALDLIFDPAAVTGLPALLRPHLRTGPNRSISLFVHQLYVTGRHYKIRVAPGEYQLNAFAENADHPELKDKIVNGKRIRFYSMLSAAGKDVRLVEKENAAKRYLLGVTTDTKLTISLKRE